MKRRAFLQQAGSAACALALPLPKAEAAPHDDAVLVKTKAGTVRGEFCAGGARAFRGVPFAVPPVGPLRFMAPHSMPPWKGVRETVDFAKMPIQSGHDEKDSSEDCLYLNVWTPPTSSKNENATRPPFPVFVWIHGGGNNSGWSGGGLYDHATFALSGVVTVTLSYRVGALGFLELGVLGKDYAGSANNGLHDLALGLRWVKNNIAAFGGDPNRITLGGESAGAKNVAALLASPESGPLINRAVMESGSGQTVHTKESAKEVTRHFLAALGLSDTTPLDAIKARLLSATTAELLKAQADATTKFGRAFPFRPLIGTPFLPKRPLDAIASGAAKGTPLLIGTNRDESLLFFARRDAERPIAARELSHLTVPQIHEQRLRTEKAVPGLSPLDMRVRLLTSEEYWIPSVRVADAHAQKGGVTFMYRFDQAETKGEREGYAPHASEVGYVWNSLPADAPKETADLARRMHHAWVSFMATGTPSAPGLPDWPRYAPEGGRKTLLFQASGDTVTDDPRETERKLWDGVL